MSCKNNVASKFSYDFVFLGTLVETSTYDSFWSVECRGWSSCSTSSWNSPRKSPRNDRRWRKVWNVRRVLDTCTLFLFTLNIRISVLVFRDAHITPFRICCGKKEFTSVPTAASDVTNVDVWGHDVMMRFATPCTVRSTSCALFKRSQVFLLFITFLFVDIRFSSFCRGF